MDKHRMTDIDAVSLTGTCSICGRVKVKKSKNGHGKTCYRCYPHAHSLPSYTRLVRRKYRLSLGDHCERCGFKPEHTCQLEIHHKDYHRTNNKAANLVTLCANCHRLVTAGLVLDFGGRVKKPARR